MDKIEIYGLLASPPTRAVMMLAEMIGIAYELKELDPIYKTDEFKKLNPQQQIPVLVDGGFVLTESRAIMRYLTDKYAKDESLYPRDLKSRAVINARLDFECGNMWTKIRAAFRPVYYGGKPDEEGVQSVRDTLQIIEEFLTINKWIAGPTLTIADVSLVTTLTFLTIFEFDFRDFPKISAWLDECKKNISSYKINEEGIKSSIERRLKLQNAK